MRREPGVDQVDIVSVLRALLTDSTDEWSDPIEICDRTILTLAELIDTLIRGSDLPIAFLESGDGRGESFLCAGDRSPEFRMDQSHPPRDGSLSPDLLDMRERWAAEIGGDNKQVTMPLLSGGIGFLSYDFVRSIESIPEGSTRDLPIPVAHFFFPSLIARLDHSTNRLHLFFHRSALSVENDDLLWHSLCIDPLHAPSTGPGESATPGPPRYSPRIDDGLPAVYDVSSSKEEFVQGVERAKSYIRAGDTFQVNLSLRAERLFDGDPFRLYRVLREVNPSPYMSFLRIGEVTVVGASPEQLVRVGDGMIATRPIAGTRRRGRTEEEEKRKEAELLGNEKEKAEHVMVVDLERNDIGRVAEFGSVTVDEFMTIERYSHVVHIVSNISARLREGVDCFDVIAAMFPGGTITGAPKVRSMEIIDELEPVARGIYTGSIGWIGGDGSMELNIAIRSIVLVDDRAYVQAGAGIVYDSVGEHEYRESLKKMAASIEAIERVLGNGTL